MGDSAGKNSKPQTIRRGNRGALEPVAVRMAAHTRANAGTKSSCFV